jgi:hypothetical protein
MSRIFPDKLPSQEQIDAVAGVFEAVAADAIAQGSAIIISKMMIRALLPTFRVDDLQFTGPIDGVDWNLRAVDVVQVALTLSLRRHVPQWLGATDEQLEAVARDIVRTLDNGPQEAMKSNRS